MISKKTTLFIGIFGGIIFLLALYATQIGLCAVVNQSCSEFFDPITENLIPFLPLFILSLITFKMRDEVYRTWFRFARWWIPFSIMLIFISPEYSVDQMFRIEKGSVALLTSALFSTISLIIVTWKYSVTRKK
ncbi:hypothetical protein HZC00_01310 [Candidatus Kaiserbacteria bacterium]|nr:hypothetical protein [Candidatus Kaiserbacteria bacterium]